MLLSILIRSIWSLIHWWISRHGNKSKSKTQFDTCSFGTKERNTWSKTLCYLLLTWNKNLNAFKSGSFCFGLLYLSKSIWPVIYGYWYSELPIASFCYFVCICLTSYGQLFCRSCWEGNGRKKWGEFGIGAFEEIVISSLWYEKNICSCQKNIAVIKIKCPFWLMVCVEWQYNIFLLSSEFFFVAAYDNEALKEENAVVIR